MRITIDLPVPPSVNRIWGSSAKNSHYISPAYAKWCKQADAHFMAQRLKVRTISGDFCAVIGFDRNKTKADLDNIATKALFDWCQSRELIENDKHCIRYSVEWVAASESPVGCRITLEKAQ